MIENLSVYNAWKRSTLDRLSGKYKSRIMAVYARHMKSLLPLIEKSLDQGLKTLPLTNVPLDKELTQVFTEHRKNVVHVAVSDGIREITPDKKLSTWMNYPYSMPVEETFITLGEKKDRDKVVIKIEDYIRKKDKAEIVRAINLEKKRYIYNIKSAFQTIAKYHYGTDPNSEDYLSRKVAKEILQSIFKKTDAHTEAVFRTETTRYFNDARVAYFQHETDVDFVQIVAVTDGRISNICECRDGYVIPIELANNKKYKPPFHVNCRSVQSPLDTDLKSDQAEVSKNLGSEFGTVHSETSDQDFKGRREKPKVPLPKGWA